MKNIEYILTSEEMQRYDRNTIQHFRIPELLLMEQAAIGAAEEIAHLFSDKQMNFLILAGKGNNGGDAMAVARLLAQKGYEVTVYIVSNREVEIKDFSESAKIQYEILKNMEIPIVTELPDKSYNIVIDGIFGVGLNREIEGNVKEIISRINQKSGVKIALDIPSGICGTTGRILGIAFQADYTITFAFLKRGLCLYPGASCAGKIIKKEIGITKESFLEHPPEMFALKGPVKEYLPKRNPAGHKGTFGKIFLIAGNKDMGGAAILAGKSAMMAGCGMLRVCTHKNQKTELLTMLPEAIVDVYETKEEAILAVEKGIPWADVIAMGPGMGIEDCAEVLWNHVIEHSNKPLILDADALNLLGKAKNYHKLLEMQNSEKTRRELILTPHPLELARIFEQEQIKREEITMEQIVRLAEKFHAVIVKKDARTLICSKTSSAALNLSGNSGMATAGSGDVLTGIIAAMVAVFPRTFEAAVTGVYLHGKCGDCAKEIKNEYSMTAGDICHALTEVLK